MTGTPEVYSHAFCHPNSMHACSDIDRDIAATSFAHHTTPHHDFVESMPFGTPAFFDDFFVPLVNDSPAGLLEDIQKTVDCHRVGISINASEGKTEAMMHLVAPPLPKRPSRPGHLMPRVTCWVFWSFIKVSTLVWSILASILE